MATVAEVDLGALSSMAAARAAPPACVKARNCLAACIARRRGGTASLPFRDKAFPLDDAFVLSPCTRRRRPCCAPPIRVPRSVSKPFECTSSSASNQATDCAP